VQHSATLTNSHYSAVTTATASIYKPFIYEWVPITGTPHFSVPLCRRWILWSCHVPISAEIYRKLPKSTERY